jgi:hypothetical protein
MPGAAAEEYRRYYAEHGQAVRVSVAGQAVSILAMLSFTREVADIVPGAGSLPRALRAAAWSGSLGSAACLAVSAATAAHLTVTSPDDDELLRRRASRVFVAGGPVHGVPYGVFVAALGLAGHRAGLWRRTGLATALTSAASSVLSPAYFRWEAAGWLIPIGRFSGYVLSGVAGVRMARGQWAMSTKRE